MKTIQAIKRLPIRAYLAERGLHPTKDNPRYGLYLSPLRKEHTPSFKVDYVQNLWYDFGLGAGGSIINLVMRLERCDFTQALRLLGSGERTQMAVRVPSSVPPTVPALRMLSDIPLRHPALVSYLSSRGSIRQSYRFIVGKCITPSADTTISLSDSATMPAAGSCVRNSSKGAFHPNALPQSTTIPLPSSHSRDLWIFCPTLR